MIINVLEYLENSAKKWPEKTAFFDEKYAFTYAEFTVKAQRLGAGIRKAAGGQGRPVAVLADRSSLSLVAMFAVLYSGNYYAPIDDALTPDKTNGILRRLDPALIITPSDSVSDIREALSSFTDIVFGLSELADASGSQSCGLPALTDADPAYVLHTSGSTGEPKGILVTHRALIDFTEDYVASIGITGDDVIGNQPPFSFDGSIRGIFPTVKTGASAYIHSRKVFTYLTQLIDEIGDRGISVLSWSTSAFRLVAGSGVLSEEPFPQTVRKVIVGGEALHAKQLNAWLRALPGAEYYNVYGPSEVIDCTYYKVDRDFGDFDSVPVGIPYPNKSILLLQDPDTPEAVGQSENSVIAASGPQSHQQSCGEICVRGAGIASGYYGDPARTAEVFIQNPLHSLYRDIIYRTGDIGRIGADGLLYFVGRTDGQIKHMGYRIELGEIEAAASGVDGIKACACLHDDEKDVIMLIYEGPVGKADIMRSMRAGLPKFMLPNTFIRIDEMPHNPNGKVDRIALKNMYINSTERTQ